mgnify:CR=1 FL=1
MNKFVIFILPDGSEQKVKREDIGAFKLNNPGSKIKEEDSLDIKFRKKKEKAEENLSNVVNIDKQGNPVTNPNIPKTSSYYKELRKTEKELLDAKIFIKSKQDLANANSEASKLISDKYENPDLFNKKTISREGSYLGKGVYMPSVNEEKYENLTDEQVNIGLNLYNVLFEQNKEKPSEEEWQTRWREELYNNERSQKIQKITQETTKNFTKEQRDEYYSINSPKVKGLNEEKDSVEISMGEIRKVIEYQTNILESSNEFKDVKEIEDNIMNPLISSPYIIGEDTEFTIINNKKIPNFIANKYNNALEVLKEQEIIIADQYYLYKKEYSDYKKISDKVFSDEIQLDIISRDYNTVTKAINSSKNFLKGGGIGIAEYASAALDFFPGKSDWTSNLATMAIEHRKNAAQEKSQFLPDVSFNEAFDSVDNFSEFILQEAAIQLPIIGAIALTGGAASAAGLGAVGASAAAATLIGVSSAGSQLGDMDYEEFLSNNDQYDFNNIVRSDLQKFLVSTGFGAAEAVFGVLPTAGILSKGMRTFSQSSKALVEKGASRYIKKRAWSGIVEPTFTESYTEGLTQLTQNFITGKPLLEGVDHAMFSGGFFGFGMGSVPTIGSLALTKFSDYDSKIEFRRNVANISKIRLEFETKYGSGDGSIFLDSKENTPQQKIEYLIERKIAEDQIKTINKKNDEILNKVDENVRSLSEESFNAYSRATVQQEKIRNEVEEIVNNPDYKITKKDRINILQERFDKLARLKDKFRNVKDFGNIYSVLEESDPKEYSIITEQAEAAVRKEEGLDLTSELNDKKVEKKRFDIYLDRLVDKDIANTQSLAKMLNADVKVFENQEEAGEYVEGIKKELSPDEKIDEIKYSNGAIIKRDKGKNTIILTKDNIKENKRTRTGVHEISHQLFAEALKDVDNNMKKELANNIYTWLSTTNESAFIEMFSGYYDGQTVEIDKDGKNFDPEEVIVGFMERVAEGKIDLRRRENRGFSQLLGNITNKGLSFKFGKGGKINFQGEKDIIDFLSGIAKSLENGVIDQESVNAIKEKAQKRKKRIIETKKATGEKKAKLLLSQGITPEMIERSNRLQEIHESEGENGVWTALEEGLFDTTIKSVINSYVQKSKTPETEYDKVYEDMVSSLKYDSDGIVDLFRTYSVEKGPLSDYVSRYLPVRSNKILKNATKDKAEPSYSDGDSQYLNEASVGDFSNESFSNSLDAIEDINNDLLDPKTLLDEKLSEQVTNNVASRIDEVSKKQKTFKDLPDLSEETTAERFGIPIDKLSLKKRFTQKELKSALGNLVEVAEDFIKILPEGAITDEAVRKDLYGTSTGLPPNILDNFYVKGDRIDTKSGLEVFDLKENVTVQDFYTAIGLSPEGVIPNRVDVRSAEAQTAKGLVNLFGKLVTNTTARQELAKRVGTEQEILNIESGKAKLMLSSGRPNSIRLTNDMYLEGIFDNKKTSELNKQGEYVEALVLDITIPNYEKYKKVKEAAVNFKKTKNLSELNKQGEYVEALVLDLEHNKLNNERAGGPIMELMFYDSESIFNTDSNFGVVPESIAGFATERGDVKFYFSEVKDAEGKYTDVFSVEVKSSVSGKERVVSGNVNRKKLNLFDRKKKEFLELKPNEKIDPVIASILNENKEYFYLLADQYNKLSGEDKKNSEGNYDVAYLKEARNRAAEILKKAGTPSSLSREFTSDEDFKKYIIDPYVNDKVEILVAEFKPYALTQEIADATGLPMLNVDTENGQKTYPTVVLTIRPKEGGQPGKVTEDRPDGRKTFSIEVAASFQQRKKDKKIYKDHSDDQLLSSKKLKERLTNYFKAKKEGKKLPKLTEAEIKETFGLKEGETSVYLSRPMALKNKFNKIIEQKEGISAKKIYLEAEAAISGENRGVSKRFRFFVPPTAEDFMGLMYSFLGKGEVGDKQKLFFEEALNLPYKRGVSALDSAKQKMADDYLVLRKEYKDVKKKLGKKMPGQEFTYDQAIRVFLWIKNGFDLSKSVSKGGAGIPKNKSRKLYNTVIKDPRLRNFALGVERIINEPEGYVEPTETWLVNTIAADMDGSLNKQSRKRYLKQFIENSEEIFNKENLNKIEAIYGKKFRGSLENSLYRMKTGINRETGKDNQVNLVENFINQSTSTIMFLNSRSALLQTISSINFINWSDNNMLSAGAAFANQDQFWKDAVTLFNSDKLKQRRKGLKLDVNQAELANSVAGSTNKVKAAYNYMVKIGFSPTQFADSAAIAFGGASFYRNRINTYLKQGKTKEQAEKQSFEDFSSIAEETQQSSDPSLISQEQSGTFGRMILAFNNVGMQYTRQLKKASLDLANKRGDGTRSFKEGAWKTHISKIIYYGAVQSIIFNYLQSGIGFLLFDDDESEKEEKLLEDGILSESGLKSKEYRAINSALDSFLRSIGLFGASIAAIKNVAIEYFKQDQKGFLSDDGAIIVALAKISPTIGSKVDQLYQIRKRLKYEEDLMKEQNKGSIDKFPYFQIDNPIYEVVGRSAEVVNIPLNRLRTKVLNIQAALDSNNKNIQRVATGMGWSTWSVGIENKEQDLIKAGIRGENKEKGYNKSRETKRKNKLQKQKDLAKKISEY